MRMRCFGCKEDGALAPNRHTNKCTFMQQLISLSACDEHTAYRVQEFTAQSEPAVLTHSCCSLGNASASPPCNLQHNVRIIPYARALSQPTNPHQSSI